MIEKKQKKVFARLEDFQYLINKLEIKSEQFEVFNKRMANVELVN